MTGRSQADILYVASFPSAPCCTGTLRTSVGKADNNSPMPTGHRGSVGAVPEIFQPMLSGITRSAGNGSGRDVTGTTTSALHGAALSMTAVSCSPVFAYLLQCQREILVREVGEGMALPHRRPRVESVQRCLGDEALPPRQPRSGSTVTGTSVRQICTPARGRSVGGDGCSLPRPNRATNASVPLSRTASEQPLVSDANAERDAGV